MRIYCNDNNTETDDEPRVVCCNCGHTAILKYCEPVKTGPKGPRMYRCAECARQRKDMLRKW